MILSLPWIMVSFLFYNGIVVYAGFEKSEIANILDKTELFSISLISGESFTVTVGTFVLITALVALFVEILKATQTRSLAILDHGLSVVVFIVCLIEFLTVRGAATSVFFFITLLALIDVVAGFSVGIRAARRDFNIPSAS
ncbi:MAG: hypothetical protein ACRBBN_13130 [Methyloligellaceae bacterium]